MPGSCWDSRSAKDHLLSHTVCIHTLVLGKKTATLQILLLLDLGCWVNTVPHFILIMALGYFYYSYFSLGLLSINFKKSLNQITQKFRPDLKLHFARTQGTGALLSYVYFQLQAECKEKQPKEKHQVVLTSTHNALLDIRKSLAWNFRSLLTLPLHFCLE